MARLNEPSVSIDSLELLRKKMLRQNRDLAKSNNVRALRIRELENECACMLSENLELRGRILELETQVEDNESRRIADHAMAIRDKLESQLTEWGILLAGLGLEPPMKKHSPRIRKPLRQRMSFNINRPSPSQRRLREVARDIEDLGQIPEIKTSPRRSMNHSQIQALRYDAIDTSESPELGPPPSSKFIDEEPVKVDSPSRIVLKKPLESSTKINMDAIMSLPSPSPKPEKRDKILIVAEKKKEVAAVQQQNTTKLKISSINEQTTALPIKTGAKRKLAARDDIENSQMRAVTNENEHPRVLADKTSIREKAGGKTLKELANMRKEAREKPSILGTPRKPLAAKDANNDLNSPKKSSKQQDVTGAAPSKPEVTKPKGTVGRPRSKNKNPAPVKIEVEAQSTTIPPFTTTITSGLGVPVPIPEPALSPSSPEPTSSGDGYPGDTPPPSDISSKGETSRPSRRNRASVSYAEPNLRDKMRRPTKEMCDAVAGEGKYSRRSSQYEQATLDGIKVKRESEVGGSSKELKPAKAGTSDHDPDSIPASPLANKARSVNELPSTVATDRRRRPSAASKTIEYIKQAGKKDSNNETSNATGPETSELAETDVYDFASSSPNLDKEEEEEEEEVIRKPRGRRRASAAIDHDANFTLKDHNSSSSRRRSMMV